MSLSAKATPLVDIVIPNWNGSAVLKNCIASIRSQQEQRVNVIVVDNGSDDGSVEWLTREKTGITCLCLSENKGFSPAVNLGIMHGSAPYVLLLNNDTELEPDTLRLLLTAAETMSEYVFFVPKMLSLRQPEMLDGAGDAYLRGGAGYRLGTMERDCACYNDPGPVFGACAGAALYRRDLFERIGLFDEDFFAYLEDVELNLRINRAGMRGYYVPAARVLHVGSATSGSRFNELTVRLSTRNSILVLAKHYQAIQLLRLSPVICIYQLAWLFFCLKKRQTIPYLRGLAGSWRYLGVMRRRHRRLRTTDRLNNREFSDCLARAEFLCVTSIMHRNESQGKSNVLLRLYRLIFLRGVSET